MSYIEALSIVIDVFSEALQTIIPVRKKNKRRKCIFCNFIIFFFVCLFEVGWIQNVVWWNVWNLAITSSIRKVIRLCYHYYFGCLIIFINILFFFKKTIERCCSRMAETQNFNRNCKKMIYFLINCFFDFQTQLFVELAQTMKPYDAFVRNFEQVNQITTQMILFWILIKSKVNNLHEKLIANNVAARNALVKQNSINIIRVSFRLVSNNNNKYDLGELQSESTSCQSTVDVIAHSTNSTVIFYFEL